MNLKNVTITGADDDIDPQDLVALSQEYPFVEWGILASKSREGSPRYPSVFWMTHFFRFAKNRFLDEKVLTSIHVCGSWVRSVLQGQMEFGHILKDLGIFDRVQLNFHGDLPQIDEKGFINILRSIVFSGRQIIFQWNGMDNTLLDLAHAHGIKVSALYDISGGTGRSSSVWPNLPSGVYSGRAGGLGPDNLRETLCAWDRTIPGDTDIWIDLETKARTDDKFDLKKVRACLEIAKEFKGRVEGSHGR